ncbi:hypothetical protein YOLOSWAG_202 [Erwinia phage vB_EamM_Yoloswag]|uniref:Uncharacterized protein n=1 Tax=Erwinia phage vB_EamM_Yoloswag TaxID=1958956 RepID=A0A1S6L3C7_9CAUD|nr:hypothetical protein HOR66_gp202 [Erwinia phage vB_EamM_Yoloswag]AQT28680.1 hypothetical protein YOLOSWAG_202 [Erwinia phage vB_EamM_Yoloswag]
MGNNFLWLIAMIVFGALCFAFGVWWTKRHPNESQRYVDQVNSELDQHVTKIRNGAETITEQAQTVGAAVASIQQQHTEIVSIVNGVKSVIDSLTNRLEAKISEIEKK